jgi:hypothetical protein
MKYLYYPIIKLDDKHNIPQTFLRIKRKNIQLYHLMNLESYENILNSWSDIEKIKEIGIDVKYWRDCVGFKIKIY